MSNTVVSYDLSYEGAQYMPLLAQLENLTLAYPASKILESLTFSRPIKWQRNMVEHTLFVDRDTCVATLVSNNLVA
jgi:hypothetical protein